MTLSINQSEKKTVYKDFIIAAAWASNVIRIR